MQVPEKSATNAKWPMGPMSLNSSCVAARDDSRVPRARDLALARALRFIKASGWAHLRVQDLCREAGASERSLQYAFRDHFGLSPRRFINAYRLAIVRQELLAADPAEGKIGDIASFMGFWHSGQFAKDYRRMFGELPSDTLLRAPARNRGALCDPEAEGKLGEFLMLSSVTP